MFSRIPLGKITRRQRRLENPLAILAKIRHPRKSVRTNALPLPVTLDPHSWCCDVGDQLRSAVLETKAVTFDRRLPSGVYHFLHAWRLFIRLYFLDMMRSQ